LIPGKSSNNYGLFSGMNLALVSMGVCAITIIVAFMAYDYTRKSRYGNSQRHSDLDIFSPLMDDKGGNLDDEDEANHDADDDMLDELERGRLDTGGASSDSGGAEEYR
jgi:hypothetical protein